jgi:hypothetical protein
MSTYLTSYLTLSVSLSTHLYHPSLLACISSALSGALFVSLVFATVDCFQVLVRLITLSPQM